MWVYTRLFKIMPVFILLNTQAVLGKAPGRAPHAAMPAALTASQNNTLQNNTLQETAMPDVDALMPLPTIDAAEKQNSAEWSSALETWLYTTRNQLQENSILNPGNQLAAFPINTSYLDLRLNMHLEQGPVDAVLEPRLVEQALQVNQTMNGQYLSTRETTEDLTITQGYLRFKQHNTSVVAGRQLFSWGPANYRSPSNPFYFDVDRTNQLANVPGIDLLHITQTLNSLKLHVAYVAETTQLRPKLDLAKSTVLKLDKQGANYVVSAIVSKQPDTAAFYGTFAQVTPADAWLIYAELGSPMQQKLLPTSNNQMPLFTLDTPKRVYNGLVGVSYTQQNGQVLTAELFQGTGGYTATQEQQYFSNAQVINQRVAQGSTAELLKLQYAALNNASNLLAQHYVWLSWQSNPQENNMYWRVSAVGNAEDRSMQLQAYIEKRLTPAISGFISGATSKGSAATEYGALIPSVLSLGFKVFLF